MSEKGRQLWTIDELGAQVALALSVDYVGQINGQVRAVPDLRTIRYYTTLGLLDRPAAMRGRTAQYGHRHLLQVVAIKRLQAKGHSLAELQQRLLGLTDNELALIAQQPNSAERESLPERRNATFWMESPEPVEVREPEATSSASIVQEVPLSDEVTLSIRPARPLDSDDMEAIRIVANPLLKLLEKRRLS